MVLLMATINFLYRSTKEKSNLHLRLLYRFNDIDFVFGANIKYQVSKDYWCKQHKKSTKDAELKTKQIEVNNELNKIENHILSAFKSIIPDVVDKTWLQLQIDNYYNPLKEDKSIPKNLVSYIDYYIEYRKNELKHTSKQKFYVIKNKLERFQTFRKRAILIKDVNDSFKNEFVDYCVNQNYSQNTMQRELVFIKTFCKHARYLGIETHPQLDSLRLDREKSEKIYLTFDELAKIENIDKSKLTDSLENSRDWLIISCFCGQRVSDFMRFTSDMIKVEKEKRYIEFTQKKTGKLMSIPLHPKVLTILEKNNGNFPYPISDQKYNDYIKVICEIAEITQMIKGSKLLETKPKSKVYRKVKGYYRKSSLVSSHIGRRSLASNFYGIIPTSLLINMTGHASESMFLTYIGKSSKDLARETFQYF